ncbi:MAG: type III-B CRISPR-associated protein Cas10/Cmr2 [Anaerolineae bacterium]|nr:type III-B CRISPR-associated protein Cas10/Cmr2 [Anaerolineae bacterium]
MSDSLLIFTIGPVQGYIAEARRAHDLWAGSQILVGMLRRAAQQAAQQGARIIYPADLSLDSLPNRFVAQIPQNKDAQAIAQAAERAAREEWRAYAQDARTRLIAQIQISPDWEWAKIWERQIENHLEVYWSIASVSESNYQQGYSTASAALGARKESREFTRADEEGPKDSLSGRRAALWVPSGEQDPTNAARKYWADLAARFADPNSHDYIPTILQHDGRERLDAIGAMKRFSRALPYGNRFPSVSSIAAASFRRAAKGKAEDALNTYAKTLNALGVFRPGDALKCNQLVSWNFDGDTFYLDTLTEQALTTDYHIPPEKITPAKLTAAQDALREVYQAVGQSPCPYYAILVMDGDKMGERVGACKSAQEHIELSTQLDEFARTATHIIEEEFAGRVVYAGGDDLLALLPLEDALPAARMIRGQFGETQTAHENKKPTISAGIVLAHHQSPLSGALRAAREAQERAKQVYGRNALCIAALKRSGEPIQVGAQWDFGVQDDSFLITEIAAKFRGTPAPLASKLAFDVLSETRALVEPDDAYAARLRWLVQRHTQHNLLTAEEQQEFANRIVQMAHDLDALFAQQYGQEDTERPRGTFEMAQWLLLARFMAQGGGA